MRAQIKVFRTGNLAAEERTKCDVMEWAKKWPCGLYKDEWKVCTTGCMNAERCDAFRGRSRNMALIYNSLQWSIDKCQNSE